MSREIRYSVNLRIQVDASPAVDSWKNICKKKNCSQWDILPQGFQLFSKNMFSLISLIVLFRCLQSRLLHICYIWEKIRIHILSNVCSCYRIRALSIHNIYFIKKLKTWIQYIFKYNSIALDICKPYESVEYNRDWKRRTTGYLYVHNF